MGNLWMLAKPGDALVITTNGYTRTSERHGVKGSAVMGAGIALAIRNAFPEAFAADCATSKGDGNKLGSISVASVERSGRSLVIVNGYTQYHWRGRGVLVDYEAVRSVMRQVKTSFPGKRIG